NGGESRSRRKDLAVVTIGGVQIADEGRRIAPRRVAESVQLQRVHRLRDRCAECGAISHLLPARGAVRSLWRRGLCSLESYLDRRVKSARLDDLFQRTYGHAIALRAEVRIDVALESHA